MSKIIIDNQTDLPDKEAIVMIVGCLAKVENDYEVSVDENIFTLKESTKE